MNATKRWTQSRSSCHSYIDQQQLLDLQAIALQNERSCSYLKNDMENLSMKIRYLVDLLEKSGAVPMNTAPETTNLKKEGNLRLS